jgi:hypothetical protein
MYERWERLESQVGVKKDSFDKATAEMEEI